MKLVKIDDTWINPQKVIVVREVKVSTFDFDEDRFDKWTEVVLEGRYLEKRHPADYIKVIYEPNIIHTYLPLDEVTAIINGGLE